MKSFDPARWSRIKLFAMDVDGVLTDGTVSIFSTGVEGKRFSILDGLGLRLLLQNGVAVAWISGRRSDATTARASELQIPHLFQGSGEKQEILAKLARELQVESDEVCYMGDDIVDLNAMSWAGIAISVPNATPQALAAADHLTQRTGGTGAVREICDLLLESRHP